jgi:hypothetical protein
MKPIEPERRLQMDEQDTRMENLCVEWQDIEDPARELFVVWYQGTELDWARAAWPGSGRLG